MNIDRLVRDVETRLAGLPDLDERLRAEMVDALREAIARERRSLDPSLTVEVERDRRRAAEELRGALEAIHLPADPEEAVDEVLKQLSRVVALDFAAVAGCEPGGAFRVLAVRGGVVAGAVMTGPLLTDAREGRGPVLVRDAEAEGAALPLAGAPALRSWVALPLHLEGDVVGLLVAGRQALDAFTEEELLRAKAVAFWAAATLRKGQLLEQVRRYAALLEQVVAVDERVFRGDGPEALAQIILEGGCRIGGYRGGLLVLQTPRGPSVAAAFGEGFAAALGRPAPPDLAATVARRLPARRLLEIAESLGTALPVEQIYLVPLAAADVYIGCLALLDPGGESPDDRLMEAYASRAAAAWRHASLLNGPS